MGNLDLLAAIKWAWMTFPAIFWRIYTVIDGRFEKTEKNIEKINDDLALFKSDIEVLKERSEKTGEDVKEIKDLLMQLLMKDKKDK